jgi:DNA invertase Pin-like site-specific DNA recombinase
MATYGYARVSTTDQSLDIQHEALEAAGCEVIRAEKVSGASRAGRAELDTLLEFIRKGDTLVVTRLDRLGRSVADLADIVRTLESKGAHLRVLDHDINTKGASGKAFMGMLMVFSEFETNIRRERQMEGIEKAKERGVYKGRKPTIEREKVKEMAARGVGATEIAKALGIGRASVYRVLSSRANS